MGDSAEQRGLDTGPVFNLEANTIPGFITCEAPWVRRYSRSKVLILGDGGKEGCPLLASESRVGKLTGKMQASRAVRYPSHRRKGKRGPHKLSLVARDVNHSCSPNREMLGLLYWRYHLCKFIRLKRPLVSL